MHCRTERMWLGISLFLFFSYFSCSKPASTAQLPHTVNRTSPNTWKKKQCINHFRVTAALAQKVKGGWEQAPTTRGWSTDIQIYSAAAALSLPGQFILPAAVLVPEAVCSWLQEPSCPWRTSATLHKGRAPQAGSQEKATADVFHLNFSLPCICSHWSWASVASVPSRSSQRPKGAAYNWTAIYLWAGTIQSTGWSLWKHHA